MDADPVLLPGLPFELSFDLAPEHWEPVVGSASQEAGVLIEAGPLTDLFCSPDDLEPSLNAPRLIGVPDSRFQLSALVDVEFGSTFDAGVLLVWANERSWAKLCLEYSPAGQPMVVSVVTRGVSDDANSRDVEGSGTWLRISTVDRRQLRLPRRHGRRALESDPPLQPRRRARRRVAARVPRAIADRRRVPGKLHPASLPAGGARRPSRRRLTGCSSPTTPGRPRLRPTSRCPRPPASTTVSYVAVVT